MITIDFVDNVVASLLLIMVLTFISEIVSRWLIFEKAGEKKYKCLIPFLSNYTAYKIAGTKYLFYISIAPLALLLVSYIVLFGGFIGGDGYALMMFCASCILYMLIIIFAISAVKQVKLSFAFGKKAGYAIGLIFLRPIFMMILAVSNCTYQGPKEKQSQKGKMKIEKRTEKSSDTVTGE